MTAGWRLINDCLPKKPSTINALPVIAIHTLIVNQRPTAGIGAAAQTTHAAKSTAEQDAGGRLSRKDRGGVMDGGGGRADGIMKLQDG